MLIINKINTIADRLDSTQIGGSDKISMIKLWGTEHGAEFITDMVR